MRSLLKRTISGIVFLCIILSALLWHPAAYAVIFTFVIVVMMCEYLKMTIGQHHKFAQVISICCGALLFLISFFNFGYNLDIRYYAVIPILVCCIFIAVLYDQEPESYRKYPYLITPILYISVPFSMLNLLVFSTAGTFCGLTILSLMIILWSSDVGAYIFGMTFGQKNGHKLFPSISPKKSWEGYIGSVITSVAAGILLYYYGLLPYPLLHCVILSLIINVTGTLGDLAESQLKRNFGVKDAGKIMPGHGGLLDRFDGALFAYPAAIGYILLLGL